MLFSKAQILAAQDRRYEVIDVPEWGEGAQVRVRSLTGRELDRFDAGVVNNGKKMDLDNLTARLCVAGIVDESGQPCFDESDVMALGNKSAAALGRCAEKIRELSGRTKKEMEDIAKNSSTIQTADSGSS